MANHNPEFDIPPTSQEMFQRVIALAPELGNVAIAGRPDFMPQIPLSNDEQARQCALNAPVATLLHGIEGKRAGQQGNAQNNRLRKARIWTVRDIFVAGTDRLPLTKLITSRLVERVTTAFPDEELKALPTASDTARICHDIRQVTARVIPHKLRMQAYLLEPPGTLLPWENWLSVGDLLNPANRKSLGFIARFDEVNTEALHYAAKFLEARRQF